jgi:hypothetical protein
MTRFHINGVGITRELVPYLVVSKVKVKLSMCLTKHHTMKAYWRAEVQLHAFFDLGTRWR